MKRRAFLGAILLALPLRAAAAPPADPGAAAVRERVRSYRVAHEAEILDELAALLALPNLASDRPNIERNAAAIVAALERRGVRTELWRVPDAPPVVYAAIACSINSTGLVFDAAMMRTLCGSRPARSAACATRWRRCCQLAATSIMRRC